MKRNPRLEERRKKVPADVKIFVEMAFKLSEQVEKILEKKGMSQRDFAKKLDKSESEISKWLSGEQNLTLRSIAKMQSILGEPLVLFPMEFEKKKIAHTKAVINTSANSIDIKFPIVNPYINLNKGNKFTLHNSGASNSLQFCGNQFYNNN